MLPVVDELDRRGHKVILIADDHSKAEEILTKEKRPFRHYYAERGVRDETDPDVFITSMCSRGGGIGRQLVPTMRSKKIPTVVVQDFWGGGDEWRQAQFQPDYITTNDDSGGRFWLKPGGDLVRTGLSLPVFRLLTDTPK